MLSISINKTKRSSLIWKKRKKKKKRKPSLIQLPVFSLCSYFFPPFPPLPLFFTPPAPAPSDPTDPAAVGPTSVPVAVAVVPVTNASVLASSLGRLTSSSAWTARTAAGAGVDALDAIDGG
jgi:hypothetical protein